MPEISEITQMSEGLNAKFSGKTLKSITWFAKPGKWTKNCAHENYSTFEKLLPLKLEKVWSKGKKIILEFDKETYLISSPLMTGSWVFTNTKHQKYQLNFEDVKEFAIFNDTRGQGLINIYFNKQELEKKLAEIGPDYLHGNITLEQYKQVITGSRIKNKEICDFMMNQKYFSGIGVWLKCEILYESKILPTRLLKDLSEDDIRRLYEKSMEIVKNAYIKKGLTIKDYLTVDGQKGEYEVKVYGRKTDNNGYKVLTGTFKDKRTSHYVVEVQM